MKYAILKYSNFFGYPHYYGEVHYGKIKTRLTHVLTERYAARLSTLDFKYKAGDVSEKFFSIQELIDKARETLPAEIECILAFDGIPAGIAWHKDGHKMDAANEVMVRYDQVAGSRQTPNSVLDALCDEWGKALGIDRRKDNGAEFEDMFEDMKEEQEL